MRAKKLMVPRRVSPGTRSDAKASTATASVAHAATCTIAGSSMTFAGTKKWRMTASVLGFDGTTGAGQLGSSPSSTVPTLTFFGDIDSGIGRAAADALSVIAGAVEAMRFTEVSSSVLQAVQADVGLTAHTDSNQGSGPILSSYNVYDIVGTAGDAATLPGTFVVGTLIYVKNGAAANSMDIFPTLGDDAGAGTDTVVALAAGDYKVFMGTTANATWEQIMGGTA